MGDHREGGNDNEDNEDFENLGDFNQITHTTTKEEIFWDRGKCGPSTAKKLPVRTTEADILAFEPLQ